MAPKTAQEIILGDAELRVLAKFLAQMLRRRIEKMRRALGEILRIDPAGADHRPIEMMFDHPFECPGLRTVLQAERGIEVESVFAFEVGANESGIGNQF